MDIIFSIPLKLSYYDSHYDHYTHISYDTVIRIYIYIHHPIVNIFFAVIAIFFSHHDCVMNLAIAPGSTPQDLNLGASSDRARGGHCGHAERDRGTAEGRGRAGWPWFVSAEDPGWSIFHRWHDLHGI